MIFPYLWILVDGWNRGLLSQTEEKWAPSNSSMTACLLQPSELMAVPWGEREFHLPSPCEFSRFPPPSLQVKMATWCCALDFYLVHTFYDPPPLRRHLSLAAYVVALFVVPISILCCFLVLCLSVCPLDSRPLGMWKKLYVERFTSFSPLLIWVLRSSTAWGCPSDKGVPRHQLSTDSLRVQKFHHIFVTTLVSLTGHRHLQKTWNYYIRVL